MRWSAGPVVAGALQIAAAPAYAREADAVAGPAVGAEIFYSSDAEETEVLKAGLNLDWRHRSGEDRAGVRLEKLRITPLGQHATSFERAYLRLADDDGGWKWNAAIGTDGNTVLGAATIHNQQPFRQEYFIEREIVETPRGVSEGIYYTFAGGSVDLPVDERNIATAFAGVQSFTGDNVRLHLRGSYVHVVRPEWGLSAQLRARYFRSSEPGEYDYYSPRWYAQVLPVLQLRRFVGGWQFLGAAGYGVQRDTEQDWKSSRYLNVRATSPRFRRDWALNANLVYSNTPVTTGFTYSYVQLALGVTRAF